MDRFEKIFDYLLKVEGGYSNDKYDAGGETKYGITEEDARKYGYKGRMRDLQLYLACFLNNIFLDIYFLQNPLLNLAYLPYIQTLLILLRLFHILFFHPCRACH